MLVLYLFILLIAVALPTIKSTATLLTRTTSLVFLFSALLVANMNNWMGVGTGLNLYSGLTNLTGVSLIGQIIMLVVGAIALTPWSNNNLKRSSEPRVSTYPVFALLTTIGGCMLVSSGDFITIYLSLELQSFSLYILAALYRDSESSTHAGLLYFLLGGLSSCLIGLGFALVYSQTGLTSIEGLMNLISVNTDDKVNWGIILGFVSLLTGLLFKITAAPFHNWGPDVYDKVPTIVTTWLAVLPKISLVFLFLTISSGINGMLVVMTSIGSKYDVWTTGLLFSSILSLVIGTVVGLAQSRIKRLLAYSTVSHMGFILISLSLSTQEGAAATVLYLVQYTLTALLSFSAILAIGYVVNSDKKDGNTDLNLIKNLVNISNTYPALSICLATALFSMAGVPPLLGFYGKQAVLYASINSNLIFVSFLAVVTSVISASYYLNLVRVSYFTNKNDNLNIVNSVNKSEWAITSMHSYLLSIMTLFVISFIVSPDLLLDICRLVALTLYAA